MGRDGERVVDMSIEETNRVRAGLGLAPLQQSAAAAAEDSKESEAKAAQAAADEAENERLRKDLAKRKRDRLYRKQVAGKSLGESLGKTSAADWVARSRTLSKSQRLAKQREEELARQEQDALPEYSANQLKNLKVQHDFGDFEEGKTVIMTLKDQSILKGVGEENDEEDELENIHMREATTLTRNKDRLKKKPVYDVHADSTELLSQYSDEKGPEGLRLGADGGLDEEEVKRLKAESIKKKLGDTDYTVGKTAYALDQEITVQADYKEKKVKFKKKKKKDKDGKKKRKKKMRAKPKAVESSLDFLPEPTAAERMQDHASRADSAKLRNDMDAEAQKKALLDQSYLKAIQKAETEKLLGSVFNLDEEDEAADVELQNSLAEARRAASKKAGGKKSKAEDPAEALAAQIKRDQERKAKELAEKRLLKREDEDGDESMGRSVKLESLVGGAGEDTEDTGMVFTATTEFCRGLEREEQKRKKKVKKEGGGDDDDEEEEEEKEASGEKSGSNGSFKNVKHEAMSDDEDEDKSEGGSGDEGASILDDEGVANQGLAATLALIRNRGFKKNAADQQSGRANDRVMEQDPKLKHIKIEYRDEYGRLLKPKEAYRQLSHKFHGKGPSAMKRDKKHRQYVEEMRVKRKLNQIGTDRTQLGRLRKKQVKEGMAYVVLDKKGAHREDLNLSKKGTGHKEEGQKAGYKSKKRSRR